MKRRSIGLLYFTLLLGYNLSAQYSPDNYKSGANNLIPLNDGYQNINPISDVTGKVLYFSKIGHPSNTGSKSDQDIWMSVKDGVKWSEITNAIPGLNGPNNDLIVGTGRNGEIYVMKYADGVDAQLRVIKVYKRTAGRYVLDHEIQLPHIHFQSEFFGFFIAQDESYVIVSMKGDNSFGKEDLYVMLKKNGSWSEPIHLGARINTIGFEMSPYMSKDGRHLFFASEGHRGYGSADIFVAFRNDDTWQNWTKPMNLGPMINTEKFEAYFSLNELEKEAYFISHRTGEQGQVYSISYSNEPGSMSLTAHPTASGFLSMEKLPAMNVKLNLLDENDRIIQSVTTNNEGYFNLQSFLPDRDYKIAIDESVRQDLKSADIFLTNDLGDNMVFMNEKELGIFGFKLLSGQKVDEVGQLETMANQGQIVDKPTTITGKVATYGTLSKNVTLNVVDEKNNVVQSITTDDDGYFSFSTNASEKSYFLSVAGNNPGLVDVYEIFLTNDNPDEDIVVTQTDKHLFEFRSLGKGTTLNSIARLTEYDGTMPDNLMNKYGYSHVERDEITGYLKIDKLPMIHTEVMLLDENDQMLEKAITDENGRFVFDEKLDEGSYKLQLSENQEKQLDKSEIYLARNPDEVLFYMNDGRSGVFAFKKLSKSAPITLYSLRTEVEQGSVVQEKTTSLKGKFEYNKLPKTGVYIKLLDENENIIQVTKVEDDGRFEFMNYQVNQNYFISVEGGEGLSDIYEVYLSGQQKNVLVNNTNRFVFAFKVLPTQDVVLSEAFERDSRLQMSSDSRNDEPEAIVTIEGLYYEFDLLTLKANDYFQMRAVAINAALGKAVMVRLSKELSLSNETELQTIKKSEVMPVVNELIELGVPESAIEMKFNARDQVILNIKM